MFLKYEKPIQNQVSKLSWTAMVQNGNYVPSLVPYGWNDRASSITWGTVS